MAISEEKCIDAIVYNEEWKESINNLEEIR